MHFPVFLQKMAKMRKEKETELFRWLFYLICLVMSDQLQQTWSEQCNEPITAWNKNMLPAPSAGKRVQTRSKSRAVLVLCLIGWNKCMFAVIGYPKVAKNQSKRDAKTCKRRRKRVQTKSQVVLNLLLWKLNTEFSKHQFLSLIVILWPL